MHQYEEITKLVGVLSSKRELYNHHGEKVAMLAMELASAAKMSAADVYLVGVGAHLHDLGKLIMHSDLFNLPRKLTLVERKDIEAHTTLGWEAVHEAGYDQMVCDAVRFHHEQWNGKGYPDQLIGKAIPVVSRIIAVCDVYSALTSDRVYRKAYEHPVAMAMVQKDKLSKFDPELVDLFFTKVAHGR